MTYLDSSGSTQTVTFTYQTFTLYYPYVTEPSPYTSIWSSQTSYSYTLPLLTAVTLPNGLSYQFEYVSNSDGTTTGEINKITLPTGGYIRYLYGAVSGGDSRLWQGAARAVVSRIVSSDGTAADEKTWNYYIETYEGCGTQPSFATVTDPLGNMEVHTGGAATTKTVEFKNSTGTVLRTVVQSMAYDNSSYNDPNLNYSCPSNPRITSETTILNDTNQQSKVVMTYGTHGNVTQREEYNWGTGAPGALARRTTLTYLQSSSPTYADKSIHILDRATSQKVYDAAGALKAQTDFEYDNFTEGISLSGAVQHDPAFGASYTTRGNLTAVKRWRNTPAATLTSRHQYDDAGNLRNTTDPLGHNTTLSYADSWANSSCSPLGGSAAAYVTSATNHLGHAATSTYHSCSGAAATATDPNQRTSSFGYDLLNRLTVTNLPDGGQTTRTYNESALPLSVTTSTKINASLNVVSTVEVDGLGRLIESRLESDPQGTVYSRTEYDSQGRKKSVTNPYRSTSDPTYGLTTFDYDALSRVTKVIPPDGSQATNNVSTTYSGNCTTVTDQAGKKRKSCADALGRLIEVWEPDASGSFIYQTVYAYDVLDNLLTVQQKGNDPNSANWRTRTFAYNSLSQLTQATNPESGAITYTYDNDGNLLTKTAPKPNQTNPNLKVTTTYTYDALHRLLTKSYNDGATPPASYFYDQTAYNGLAISNGIGRRTGMADTAGQEAWSYDVMGRVLTSRRTTNGVTKDFSYTYNLDGSVATLTYPTGSTITYNYNAAGRALSASGGGTSYASNAAYAPHGALATLRHNADLYGFAWRERLLTYNNRLQPVSIRVDNVFVRFGNENHKIAWQLTYNFGLGSANNGNVLSIEHLFNPDRTQIFTYDQLNRIDTAKTQATSGSLCWGLDHGYDPWGNLLSIGAVAGYGACTQSSLSVVALNNNRLSGFSYDAAGNMTTYPGYGSYT
ncbi:MAG: hypothetical protein ACREA0_03425, partial [bacterium]